MLITICYIGCEQYIDDVIKRPVFTDENIENICVDSYVYLHTKTKKNILISSLKIKMFLQWRRNQNW